MAGRADLYIYQGDDYTALVTVMSDASTPADITGYTAQAQIREDVADNVAEVAVDIVTDVFSPYISLKIPSSVTVNLCGAYVWDLQVTDPGGLITTLLSGAALVTAEVTR